VQCVFRQRRTSLRATNGESSRPGIAPRIVSDRQEGTPELSARSRHRRVASPYIATADSARSPAIRKHQLEAPTPARPVGGSAMISRLWAASGRRPHRLRPHSQLGTRRSKQHSPRTQEAQAIKQRRIVVASAIEATRSSAHAPQHPLTTAPQLADRCRTAAHRTTPRRLRPGARTALGATGSPIRRGSLSRIRCW
jgi:hypothetical protein